MNVLGTPLDAHQEDDDDDGEDILDDIGVLRRGSRGDGVDMMQEALGLERMVSLVEVLNVH